MSLDNDSRRYLDYKFDQLIVMIQETNRLLGELIKQNANPPVPQMQIAPYTVPYTKDTLACPVCGIGSNGPMGYVCNRRDCPSGVVTCTG